MVGLKLILLVFAFVCFVLAVVWNPQPVPARPNLIAAGLAFWVGSLFL